MQLEEVKQRPDTTGLLRVATATRRLKPADDFYPHVDSASADDAQAARSRDSSHVTALIMEVAGARSVFISIECAGLDRARAMRLRRRIADDASAAFDAVHIASVRTSSAALRAADADYNIEVDQRHSDMIAEQIIGSVKDCLAHPSVEVSAHAIRYMPEGFFASRRALDEVADREVFTLEFRDGRGCGVAGLCGLPCYPAALGSRNDDVSGDFAIYLANYLSLRWGVRPVCMIGASVDAPGCFSTTPQDSGDLAQMRADLVAQPKVVEEIPLSLREPRISTLSLKAACRRDGRLETDVFGATSAPCDLVCTLADYGDLRVFAVPAELSARIGAHLREALDAPLPICWCQCDCNAGRLESTGGATGGQGGGAQGVVRELMTFIERSIP
ncbi:hypothetical protein Corgl_0584 [Coriobacterium glomerans PW2]|uniref:Uncharacterized protein n=1 Tax=Coriobacterium glomerans (strain ATCC 49209 / DSM 20642 / JCM 10262 / PW2) TaxID=700015 RepID=F2NBG2_CORGP|nr:hypothetical protein [Coriobacterium glomerans]AEB06698.1 hypothetical protein Corgl_0584 [Coriobacterium glomerans PW2]